MCNRRPSDVQHAPIRKIVPAGLCVASRLLLLISGRSLREDARMKIRASTIFIRVSSLAELIFYIDYVRRIHYN